MAIGGYAFIKNKGTPEAKKDEPPEVAKTRGPAPKQPTKTADPDRKAAEYVLSIGGIVNVNGEQTATTYLPKGPVTTTAVNLGSNQAVTDAGLAIFKDCKALTTLNLSGTRVTDAGLANFSQCKNLTNLNLYGTQVSDAGLVYFKDCKELTSLELSRTQVSDVGLTHFEGCKNLSNSNCTKRG